MGRSCLHNYHKFPSSFLSQQFTSKYPWNGFDIEDVGGDQKGRKVNAVEIPHLLVTADSLDFDWPLGIRFYSEFPT